MAGKYLPLTNHLEGAAPASVPMTFEAVGRLVGGLPPSAYKHREWWANNGHGQAQAWATAGYRVIAVDLRGQRVTFECAGVPNGHSRATANPPAGEQEDWPSSDDVSVRVRFTWRDAGRVVLDAAGKPRFPELPQTPGLYRLTFTGAGFYERARVYVGETDNLRRRLASNYRSPGPSQQTSLRVNALLRDHIAAGGDVHVAAVLDVRVIGSDAEDEAPLDLRRKAGRLLAENAALLALHTADAMDIENLG